MKFSKFSLKALNDTFYHVIYIYLGFLDVIVFFINVYKLTLPH